jgi:hypothetical protein
MVPLRGLADYADSLRARAHKFGSVSAAQCPLRFESDRIAARQRKARFTEEQMVGSSVGGSRAGIGGDQAEGARPLCNGMDRPRCRRATISLGSVFLSKEHGP